MCKGGAEVCVKKREVFFEEKRNMLTREERIREKREEKMMGVQRRGGG